MSKITLQTSRGAEVVFVKDIIRVEAARSYCVFFLYNKNQIVASKNLGHYTGILEKHDFFRVHKSRLVNVDAVTKFVNHNNECYVLMADGSCVNVSVRKKQQLMQAMLQRNPVKI